MKNKFSIGVDIVSIERIRDIFKIEDGLVLFLEDTASIAFIDLN